MCFSNVNQHAELRIVTWSARVLAKGGNEPRHERLRNIWKKQAQPWKRWFERKFARTGKLRSGSTVYEHTLLRCKRKENSVQLLIQFGTSKRMGVFSEETPGPANYMPNYSAVQTFAYTMK